VYSVIRTLAALCGALAASGVVATEITENDPARMAEIEAMGAQDDAGSRQTLLALAQNRDAGSWERVLAVKALAQTQAGGLAVLKLAADGNLAAELQATVAFACASSPAAEVAAQAGKVLPLPPTKDGKPVPVLHEACGTERRRAGGRVGVQRH